MTHHGSTVVVTRHPALVDYLREIGILPDGARIITHASPDDVRDRHVIGILPLHLATLALTVTEIPLAVPPEARGRELSLDEMRRWSGAPVVYVISTHDSVEAAMDYRHDAACA